MEQASNGLWTHGDIAVNDIRLHYVEAGDGPLVLLLHGFPEFWYGWRYQIPTIAAAGFRVVAPDMRGYDLSYKPRGLRAYHIDNLAADTAALLRHFGGDRGGFLVGHDWGGLVAWHTASRRPDLVRKLVILNAPHPNRYAQLITSSASQWLRSQYVVFFQLPRLPEWLLTRKGGHLVEQTLRRALHNPAQLTAEDGRRYREAITRPGAATAALNYYRAIALRTLLAGVREPEHVIRMPVLLLWGVDDPALDIANTDEHALRRWVPNLRVERLDAGHFVQMDRPDAVNAQIVAFCMDGMHFDGERST